MSAVSLCVKAREQQRAAAIFHLKGKSMLIFMLKMIARQSQIDKLGYGVGVE